jgi:hypothetical protein
MRPLRSALRIQAREMPSSRAAVSTRIAITRLILAEKNRELRRVTGVVYPTQRDGGPTGAGLGLDSDALRPQYAVVS